MRRRSHETIDRALAARKLLEVPRWKSLAVKRLVLGSGRFSASALHRGGRALRPSPAPLSLRASFRLHELPLTNSSKDAMVKSPRRT